MHTKPGGTQKFQKPRSHLKNLGVGRAIRNKLNNEDPQVLGATVEKCSFGQAGTALCTVRLCMQLTSVKAPLLSEVDADVSESCPASTSDNLLYTRMNPVFLLLFYLKSVQGTVQKQKSFKSAFQSTAPYSHRREHCFL
jgi:hypothetical protein